MSLKSQIENPKSILGHFVREVFPSSGNRECLAEIKQKLVAEHVVGLLEERTPPWIYSLVGSTIDYRIRYHFSETPISQYDMAQSGAWLVTDIIEFPSLFRKDPSRFSDYKVLSIGEFPNDTQKWSLRYECHQDDYAIWTKGQPDLKIFDFDLLSLLNISNPDLTRMPLECTVEFFEGLAESASRVAAHKRAPTHAEELELARCCFVLSAFESCRRNGGKGWPPPFLAESPPKNADDLLNAVPDRYVQDVVALADAFTERYADQRGAPAVLNPVFRGSKDVGGADGDIVVDGCLWDIKTTTRTKGKGVWLYQILGYALLDYENDYEIEHIGFLFPRQNTSVRWELSDMIRKLSKRPDLSILELRQEVRNRLQAK